MTEQAIKANAKAARPTPAEPTQQPDAGEREPLEGGRESVDDALAVVESFGPGIDGVNDTFARQILLATEVRRLRSLYERAVTGRASFRSALRRARGWMLPPIGCPACGILHEENSCASAPVPSPQVAQGDERPLPKPALVQFEGIMREVPYYSADQMRTHALLSRQPSAGDVK